MPLMPWAAHVLQWPVQRDAMARGRSGSLKAGPSSDWGLQPAPMKSELLVIADQHAAVNAFPGLVHTARHTTRVVCTRSRRPNHLRGEAPKVWRVRGVKS